MDVSLLICVVCSMNCICGGARTRSHSTPPKNPSTFFTALCNSERTSRCSAACSTHNCKRMPQQGTWRPKLGGDFRRFCVLVDSSRPRKSSTCIRHKFSRVSRVPRPVSTTLRRPHWNALTGCNADSCVRSGFPNLKRFGITSSRLCHHGGTWRCLGFCIESPWGLRHPSLRRSFLSEERLMSQRCDISSLLETAPQPAAHDASEFQKLRCVEAFGFRHRPVLQQTPPANRRLQNCETVSINIAAWLALLRRTQHCARTGLGKTFLGGLAGIATNTIG